ncbi:extracellular solute-binding protein [Lentibacillus sp.]|uniref:extracellular solute-binding protein n=1 Tax=Lentibacillus sp. TaxID=1925746 RepID=UPI002B4B4B84|nr:extracellular solute-binding protein [Lentibacillus sp.]HLS08517.1 extracellular solute-binding protein [Lentibacillus sp.]
MLFMSTLAFLMAGCSGAEDSNANSEEGKTVKFMHLWPEGSSAEHNRIVDEIIEKYESENEGVTIELEVLSNEQYKDKIKVLSTSDELPDVGMTWAAGYLEPYVEGDKFASFNDVLESDGLQDSFVSGTTEAFSVDGTTYGLPLELNIATVFYNKSIFEEHGLEAPETLEEFHHVVQTLDENGVEPIALGNSDRWTGSLWYMYFADRIGGSDVLTSAINREGSFEDPALVQAAEEVQNLVGMNAFNEGFNGLSDQEAKSMFMNEQTAMYLIATWDLPNYTTNEEVPQEFRDSVGYFDFPTVDGNGDKNSYVGGPGVGLFVAENSEVKEEAKDFASFFVQQWGEKSVSEAGVIPATKVDADSLDLPQMYVDVLDDLNNASNITLFADVQMSPDTAEVHLNQIQALFGGEVTPGDFAKAHEKALSEEE